VGEKLPHRYFRIMKLPLVLLGNTVGENLPMRGWVVMYPEGEREQGRKGAGVKGEFSSLLAVALSLGARALGYSA
jgi:hypothetical protein